jgi:hypothetical protein
MGHMIPVFQLRGISSVVHIIVISLCIASIISSSPHLINSAIIPSSPGALLFLVFLMHSAISLHVGVFTSSLSSVSLLILTRYLVFIKGIQMKLLRCLHCKIS